MGPTPTGKAVFELSWEVCNKVGGIYSVIMSKASLMKDLYKEYYALGPYFESSNDEFQEESPPKKFLDAFEELISEGLRFKYGTWQVKGKPKAILIDFSGLKHKTNDIRHEFWESHGIDSLFSGSDFDDPMLLSYAAALLLKRLEDKKALPIKTILHAHEWMSGFSIMKLKNMESEIKTVFTTHATMLGRSLCQNNYDLYGNIGNFDPYEEAKRVGVIDKFTAERASAHSADVFTTVSEITGKEAEHILGRKPDVLVLNGLNMEKFPSVEETAVMHVKNRDIVREFVSYTFFPHYTFNLKQNLIFAYAGRYEYGNKGLDVFIDSLSLLNDHLKLSGSDKTVSAILFIAMQNNGVKSELLENKNSYRHIKHFMESKKDEIINNMIESLLESKKSKDIMSQDSYFEISKHINSLRRKGLPVICTHNINEYEDTVIRKIRSVRLSNSKEDKVKILLYPAYLDGNDGLLNIDYYDVLSSAHLGVFPSYYEPWGYTTLESAALAVPSVTTDLSGFGKYVLGDESYKGKGIYVIKRDKKSYEEVVRSLFETMKKFSELNHSERVREKLKAKQLSEMADWKFFINNYIEAHNKCFNN